MKKAQILILGFSILSLSTSFAESLDCKKAKSQREKMTCSDPELQKLDSHLNEAYVDLIRSTPKQSDRNNFKGQQREWLVQIADKCNNKSCLREALQGRAHELYNTEIPFSEDEDNPNCRSDTTTKNKVLKASVISLSSEEITSCRGQMNIDCWVTVENLKMGKPMSLNSLFKKGIDPIVVLKKICEKENELQSQIPNDGGRSNWFENCDELVMHKLGLDAKGIEVFLDKTPSSACGSAEIIKWNRLREYLDPNGPVEEAHRD